MGLNLDEQYKQVISAPDSVKRADFGRYCRLVIDAVEIGDLTNQEGAYHICGTAARILDVLSTNDRELMAAAGNLELPEAQRDVTQLDWKSFKTRVEELFPVE